MGIPRRRSRVVGESGATPRNAPRCPNGVHPALRVSLERNDPMTLTTQVPPWLQHLGIPMGLGGLVLGLGWYLFVSGYGAEIELRRGQLEALSREVGQGAGLEQQLQERSSRNRGLVSKLASLEAALPEEEAAMGLPGHLQEAAAASGLKVKGIRKMPAQEGETFSREPHGLVLAGAYHDLGGFCGRLSGLGPIVSLEDLRIAAAGSEDPLHTLTADLTAVLHRYRPAADKVEAPADSGLPADSASPARQTAYPYRARGRRDPFGLPRAPAPLPPAAPTARPLGLKGQRVSELKLVGLVEAGGEYTALATGRRDRSFLLKKGDRLFDGRVLEIGGDGVVFSERVEGDDTGKRTRRVVRKLHPAPGEAGNGN